MEAGERLEYVVNHPKRFTNIILFSLLLGILLLTFELDGPVGLLVAEILWMALIVAMIGYWIFGIKEKTVRFDADSLYINHRIRVNAKDVDRILLDFNKIGIKVRGKKMVPMQLYFAFRKSDRMDGLAQLRRWAEKNNVSIQYKSFMMWV